MTEIILHTKCNYFAISAKGEIFFFIEINWENNLILCFNLPFHGLQLLTERAFNFFFLEIVQDYYASIWFTFHCALEIQNQFLLLHIFICIKENCKLNHLGETITHLEMILS